MKVPHKHAEVIKAWADGAEVQWKAPYDDEWTDATIETILGFFGSYQYRVKPEPKPDVVIEEELFLNGSCLITHKSGTLHRSGSFSRVRYTFDAENGYRLKSVEIVK